MNRLLHIIIGVSCALVSTTGISAPWVGIEAGLGSSQYKSASDDIDTSWVGALNLGYDFSPNWGMSLGFYTGSGTSVPKKEIGVATEANEELDYSAVSLNANWNFALSSDHSFYVSVGANYNQTEVSIKSEKTIDGSGIGYTARAGWQYHIGRHYLVGIGLQRLGLSDVDVNSVNVGFSYKF
jgi:opacity protein-like surface antigen